MKKFLKKVSLLSSAALVALGLGMPLASAAAPTADTMGALYDGTGFINKAVPPEIALVLASTTYNGSAQQIITEVTTGAPAGATLYLRVADSEGAAPSSSSDWVAYNPEDSSGSLGNSVLKRTNVGSYKVYYYIDGGQNYQNVPNS